MPRLLPPPTPVQRRSRVPLLLVLVLALVALAVLLLWVNRFGEAEDYDDMDHQFKYGSIGADNVLAHASLPYWVWRVLPQLNPPEKIKGNYSDRPSFENFGFVDETATAQMPTSHSRLPALERPIGFSRRRVFGMDFVGMNCSICHLTTYRTEAGRPRRLVIGGTGNTVDIERYFRFLFSTLGDPAIFNAKNVMPLIDKELARQRVQLPWHQHFLYQHVLIPYVLPWRVHTVKQEKFDFIDQGHQPEFGPGRVDTWALYKRMFVDPPQKDGRSAISDFPSLWNQQARAGMRMHWDGNNADLTERNVISALSLIGTKIEYLDFDRLTRVTEWSKGALPPRYEDRSPYQIDHKLAQEGSVVFGHYCAGCHSAQSDRVGRVEPIEDLGTDAARINEFTPELRDGINALGTKRWQLRHFTVENGYVNKPLEGVWLLAPYLHNGSVPTIVELLKPPAARPDRFCRGGDVYDWKNLGFVASDVVGDRCENGSNQFVYDTRAAGNSNKGHPYGTGLSDPDKNALIEFLKTL